MFRGAQLSPYLLTAWIADKELNLYFKDKATGPMADIRLPQITATTSDMKLALEQCFNQKSANFAIPGLRHAQTQYMRMKTFDATSMNT